MLFQIGIFRIRITVKFADLLWKVFGKRHLQPFGFSIHFGSTLEAAFGVDDRDMPCAVLETDPGDVIVFDQKIKHATFGGGKRRMFWMIFGARCHDEEDFAKLRGNIHNYAEYGLDRIFSQRMISTAGPRRMVHLEQAWANDGELARRSAARTPAAGPGS